MAVFEQQQFWNGFVDFNALCEIQGLQKAFQWAKAFLF